MDAKKINTAAVHYDTNNSSPDVNTEYIQSVLRKGQIGQNNEKAYQMRSKFCSQCGPNADQY